MTKHRISAGPRVPFHGSPRIGFPGALLTAGVLTLSASAVHAQVCYQPEQPARYKIKTTAYWDHFFCCSSFEKCPTFKAFEEAYLTNCDSWFNENRRVIKVVRRSDGYFSFQHESLFGTMCLELTGSRPLGEIFSSSSDRALLWSECDNSDKQAFVNDQAFFSNGEAIPGIFVIRAKNKVNGQDYCLHYSSDVSNYRLVASDNCNSTWEIKELHDVHRLESANVDSCGYRRIDECAARGAECGVLDGVSYCSWDVRPDQCGVSNGAPGVWSNQFGPQGTCVAETAGPITSEYFELAPNVNLGRVQLQITSARTLVHALVGNYGKTSAGLPFGRGRFETSDASVSSTTDGYEKILLRLGESGSQQSSFSNKIIVRSNQPLKVWNWYNRTFHLATRGEVWTENGWVDITSSGGSVQPEPLQYRQYYYYKAELPNNTVTDSLLSFIASDHRGTRIWFYASRLYLPDGRVVVKQ